MLFNVLLLLISLVALPVVLFTLWCAYTRASLKQVSPAIPGDVHYLPTGCVPRIRRLGGFHRYLKELCERFPNSPLIASTPFLYRHLVVVNEPEFVAQIFSNRQLINRGPGIDKMFHAFKLPSEPLEDIRGLFALEQPRWEVHRKLLTPAFAKKPIREIVEPVVREMGLKFVNRIEKLAQVEKSGQVSLDTAIEMSKLTFDVIALGGFGLDVGSIERSNRHPLLTAMHDIIHVYAKSYLMSPLPAWLLELFPTHFQRKRQATIKMLYSFLDPIIKDARERAQDTDQRSRHLGDILVKMSTPEGASLSDPQMRGELNTFLTAGSDTTSATLSAACYVLGRYPEWQKKVFDEISAAIGDVPAGGERDQAVMDCASRSELPILEAVIKETMRLYPIAPGVARYNDGADVSVSWNGVDYTIPTDTLIICPIYSYHRSKVFWGPDAEEFRPERWMRDDGKQPFSVKGAYVPFGLASRICIGRVFAMQELRIVLALLVSRLSVSLPKNAPELVLVAEFVLAPKEGHALAIFEPRT